VWSQRFTTHPAARRSWSPEVAPLLQPGHSAATESTAPGDSSAPVGDRRGWRWRGPTGLEEVEGARRRCKGGSCGTTSEGGDRQIRDGRCSSPEADDE
jgi:hypothetical protein